MNNKSVFKNFIDNRILEYPILYFSQDYTRSKMKVLDQIFFVIGNGLEFKNGYPICNNSNHKMIKYDKVDIDEFFKNNNPDSKMVGMHICLVFPFVSDLSTETVEKIMKGSFLC